MMGITAKQFNFIVYYCQPYSSFQRGTYENINWLVLEDDIKKELILV